MDSCCSLKADDESLDHAKDYHDFSIVRLAWAIQKGLSIKCIERYLSKYEESSVQFGLGVSLKGPTADRRLPILFFAAERNSPELIRCLCRLGANPDTRADPSGLPLLAYTIFSAEYEILDTTPTLRALLAAGADPHDVPEDLWQDYLKLPSRLPAAAPSLDWCTSDIQDALCRTINLMQTYSLWKADKLPRPLPRMKQCADVFDLAQLFEAPFSIIGQLPATEQVMESITSHFLFGACNPDEPFKPLVLLFTGQSGHGKTELAKRMGRLLSLDTISVDCAEMENESDIFGAKPHYQGSEEGAPGAPLNDHLANCSGRPSVVFLDEFDKTQNGVRKAMLLLFQSGHYINRRNRQKLDCSKTIWILATNEGERIINKFCNDSFKDHDIEKRAEAIFSELDALLRSHFIRQFGAPITGRINTIVPFFPFSRGERAVVVSKYMLGLGNQVRRPIDIKAKKLAGHTHLNVVNDGQIALHIATNYYDPETGARSLDNAVDAQIKHRLMRAIQSEPELVADENNHNALERYDVRLVTILKDTEAIAVKRMGSTELQTPHGKYLVPFLGRRSRKIQLAVTPDTE